MPHHNSTVHPEIDIATLNMKVRQPLLTDDLLGIKKQKQKQYHQYSQPRNQGPSKNNKNNNSSKQSGKDGKDGNGSSSTNNNNYYSTNNKSSFSFSSSSSSNSTNNCSSDSDSSSEGPIPEFLVATRQPSWYSAGEPIDDPYAVVAACRREWIVNPDPGKSKADSRKRIAFATCRLIPAYPVEATDRHNIHSHLANDFDRAWISLATPRSVVGDWCFFPFVPPAGIKVPSLAHGCPHPVRFEVRFYVRRVSGDGEANFWLGRDKGPGCTMGSTFGIISVSQKVGEAFGLPFVVLNRGETPVSFMVGRNWNYTLKSYYIESTRFLVDQEKRLGGDFDDDRISAVEDRHNRLIWRHLQAHGILNQPPLWGQAKPTSVLL
ncbi:hypothetical protein N3K66_004177 [Trichothecium roseum]|uniref:Uncharacterized protein n=1 Tax=Trichothecium roseum TaxID=47278 RepID=A0ACC0V1X8_9HYPO|nr:hypothetical protein N3K66_004177 [Trichothecium roseum]